MSEKANLNEVKQKRQVKQTIMKEIKIAFPLC
jgi:uncharacterized protein YlxP (DUF503 family)